MRILTPQVEKIGRSCAALGESAIWLAEDGVLLWVDIVGRKVLRTKPEQGTTDEWFFPEQTGFVQPTDDGSRLIGQQRGILRFDASTGCSENFIDLESDDPKRAPMTPHVMARVGCS